MAPEDEIQMRAETAAEMADVENPGLVERQVCLAIPAETPISPEERSYKPVFHVDFAFKRDRTDDKMREVCMAGAAVLHRYFAPFGVEEVQITWGIDEADRFDRFPAKS